MLNRCKPVIGIDIGSHAVKLTVMSRQQQRWALHVGMSWPTADNAARALANMLDTLPGFLLKKKPTILVAIPCANVMLRRVVLPAMLGSDQIDMAVRIELEKDLPAQEHPGLFVDYDVIPDCDSSLTSNTPNTRSWLAAACCASVMQSCLETLRLAGLIPSQVAIDVLVLDRTAHSGVGDPAQHLYIDAGFRAIRLYALSGGVPGYIRSHALGNHEQPGVAAPELLLTLRRALQQYRLSEMLAQPSQVLVFGGRSATPGLAELVKQFCGSATHYIDPLTDWPVDDIRHGLSCASISELAPTIALAMQEPARW